ncbi:DUF3604 domain-containing protein [Paenibacillus radicis (ex Xue et al. 2023)]|uniref:DUF3604 domain-containing protein n=1 Tax=Paenibacillus radicis (ex Xue et al. 2023) TaxID=2972489 RepID=A0ABT1YGC8_9BACL|nr:DUF3604 domain-containing protein [Paenibacillus radicis (ex Xue et al. 2023)]MCR8632260.1 DUF3604 domain-containing protein [Paenibacillus radicis (ex Xue et al. 2023)]
MALNVTNGVQAHCSSHRQFAYELTWLPEKNYVPGSEVDIRAGLFRQFHEWKIHHIEMERVEILFSPNINKAGPDVFQNRKQRLILKVKLLHMIPKGQPQSIKLVATPPLFAGMDTELFVWVREPLSAWAGKDAELNPVVKEAADGCRLTVQAGPVERFSVYSQPASGVNGKIRTSLVPEDRYGNPSQFEKPVTVKWSWLGESASATVQQSEIIELATPEQATSLKVLIRMDELSIHENIANGRVDGEFLVVTGNPVVAQAKRGLLPAFGDIHWHTQEASGADGGRPMTDAFASARDELNMNFAAPSDHDPEGAEWEQTVQIIDAYNDDDRFATLYGWENSTNRGHENYYFTDPNHAAVRGGKAEFKPENLEMATKQLDTFSDFIAVPHHTNSNATMKKDGVPAWHQYNWSEPREYRRLVEIVQNRGNQEKNDYADVWRGLVHNHSASVQDALRAGHKLGFTGGTDNHVGWPGRVIYQNRKSVILTGLWTERVERQSIFYALWNRHTWAVCDTRAIVWFTINGVLMGGDIQLAQGEALTAHIQIHAEAPLQAIEIVSEGQTVWASSSSSPVVDVQVPLGQVTGTGATHYYLRAVQRDGGFMYASPVFVEKI